jgi:hypothetical protein
MNESIAGGLHVGDVVILRHSEQLPQYVGSPGVVVSAVRWIDPDCAVGGALGPQPRLYRIRLLLTEGVEVLATADQVSQPEPAEPTRTNGTA